MRLKEDNTNFPAIDSWDRIYNISELNPFAPIVYYYQDLLSSEFHIYHQRLLHLSTQGKIRYIFFSISKKFCKNISKLSCYGAALNVKNSDYKTLDDSKINLFSHKIPEILLNYQNPTKNTSNFIIPKIPESMISFIYYNNLDLFFSMVELISKSKKQKRFEKLVDILQNLPSFLRFDFFL